MAGTSNKAEALADAVSGVVGTLVSLWCFYPIERLKTNAQAGTNGSTTGGSSLSSSSSSLSLKPLLLLLKQSFRGCGTKSLHATASSFCYFYFYSWILSFYNNKRRIRLNDSINNNTTSGNGGQLSHPLPPLRPSTRLLLAAIAAMLNTFVTLPLDVLSSQHTVGSNNNATNTSTTKTKTKTTTTTTKSKRMSSVTAWASTSESVSENRAIMTRAWNSIGDDDIDDDDYDDKEGMPPNTTTKTTNTTSRHRKASTAGTGTSLASSPASSAEPSSVVELVFHEAFSCSEDLFSRHGKDDSKNDNNINDNNANTNAFTNAFTNASRCSSSNSDNSNNNSAGNFSRGSANSSSNSSVLSRNNEDYKARWRERQLRRKKLKNQRQQQQLQSSIASFRIHCLGRSSRSNSPSRYYTNRITNLVLKWSKLWKGLAPALLLCSNPSIHYTVFDVLKTKLVASKSSSGSKRQHNTTNTQQQQYKLSVSEAFVLGLVSKFIATIVTYPLIRAKVLMMVRGDDEEEEDDDDDSRTENDENNNTNNNYNNNDTTTTTTKMRMRRSASSSSLVSVLQESYQRDGGVKGLYKGCDWQLIHTLLKSALMMAIREQITGTSRALFKVPLLAKGKE
uniref:Uncharacterized protein n=1 Tax=Pseudo-nitzschia australis TaxID=44445 RepID=A0A7S4ENG2_9STRA